MYICTYVYMYISLKHTMSASINYIQYIYIYIYLHIHDPWLRIRLWQIFDPSVLCGFTLSPCRLKEHCQQGQHTSGLRGSNNTPRDGWGNFAGEIHLFSTGHKKKWDIYLQKKNIDYP